MGNPLAIIRALLIYGICVPLAIYLGYLLATPLDLGTLMAVGFVLLVLVLPLLLRWHHPLLILSWNLNVVVFFLPGQPQLWLLMAGASLAIALVQRTLSRQSKFLLVRPLVLPVLFLLAVIVATGWFTGGLGLRIANSGTYGGKRYFLLIGAILGFFAFCSRRIPPEKANLYAGLFFLPGVMALFSSCFPLLNSAFYFMYLFFPADPYMVQAYTASSGGGAFADDMVRLSGLAFFSQAVFCFLLARHGIRGLLQARNWWRAAFLLLAMVLGLYGGFRSVVVLMALIFGCLFWLEGLLRTRYFALLLAVGVLGMGVLVPFTRQLPLPVQRALSFLPVQIDPVAAADAQGSTEWRLRMWRVLLPEIPHYLLLGKGYGINAQDLELAQTSMQRGVVDDTELAMLAGDYHSGPLSTIIPLGLWGVLGFLWLLVAGTRVLWRNWKGSPPELQRINAFLLALFVAKIIFFLVIFGSLYSDLATFLGLLGLSVSLNGGISRPAVAPPPQTVLRDRKWLSPVRG
jgi:hypothetical protein